MASMRLFGDAVRISGVMLLCCACGGESGSESNVGTGGAAGTGTGGLASGGLGSGGLNSGGGGAGGASTGGVSTGGANTGGSVNTGGSGGAVVITNPGTVTDTWSAYCVATFISDYEVLDSFDDPLFTAHAGEQYLMMSYPDVFGGPNSAEMIYLTEHGPLDFQVDAGDAPQPFTTDCPKDTSVPYYAVFKDVSLYSDSTLTTKLCDLTAGTVLPIAGAGGYGFALSSSSNGQAVYDINLNAFSAQCGGAERGYVLVPTVQVLGQNTYLIPIRNIIGPS